MTDSLRRLLSFERLEAVSFFHSLVYLALLIVAFGLGNPQPYTFVSGLSHGLLWIGMSLVCLTAVRLRVIPLRIAVAVAVLGGHRAVLRERRIHPRAASPRTHPDMRTSSHAPPCGGHLLPAR